jgi:hypothetical protein
VLVAGEQSGNVVLISPDGISSKELYKIPNPRAMCYDKNENKILICNTDNKASWIKIEYDPVQIYTSHQFALLNL